MIHAPWFRYSLAGIVLIALAVAGHQWGYRDGYRTGHLEAYQAGYDSERSKLGPARRVTPRVREYDVAKLVRRTGSRPQPADPYAPLIDLITSVVAADTWDATELVWIRPDHEQKRLVVNQTDGVHAQIEDYLKSLHGSCDEYEKRIAKHLCGYCGEAPLPRLGEECKKCSRVY